jgi:hypothetical protein
MVLQLFLLSFLETCFLLKLAQKGDFVKLSYPNLLRCLK